MGNITYIDLKYIRIAPCWGCGKWKSAFVKLVNYKLV